jgi:PAS domain S-box-containing protein
MGLEEACLLISKQIEELFKYDGFYVDLFNPETNLLSNIINIDTINGVRTSFRGSQNRKITSPIIEKIIDQRKPILINRNPDSDFFDGLHAFGDTSKRALSLMFAPLLTRSEIVGVISVQSYTYQAFSERDLEILTNLAIFLGVSIKNILLYQTISQSEIQYRTLLENLPDSIYSISIDGFFTAANSKTCKLLNVIEQDLVGYRALDYLPKDLRRIFLHNFKKVLDTNNPVTFEFSYIKDSKLASMITTLAPIISANGEIRELHGITRDITGQKEAEANNLKIQRQEAEAKRQEFIVNMTRNIAHVFNNILVNVLSRSSFAKSLIDHTNIAYSHLEKIELSSKKFSDLVKQLLDFSQSRKFKFELTDLNKIVQVFCVSKKVQLSSNIELKVEINKVETDRDQILNILEKLVNNSSEAIKDKGIITISTKNFENIKEIIFFKQVMPQGKYVLITISDDGEGINDNVLERLFEPFNTTKEYGRGLGLPGVYGIILNLSGYINIKSTLKTGTSIEIYFPTK